MSITKIDKFVGQWTWNAVLCNEVKLENRTTESWEKYDRDITIAEKNKPAWSNRS